MSFNKNTTSTMAKIVGMLWQMSGEKGGDQKKRGGDRHLRVGRGYARVPSRATLSASTTSTSLATDCGSHLHLHLPRTHPEHGDLPIEEEATLVIEDDYDPDEISEPEDEADFEQVRLHFQQSRQISLGSANKYKMEMEIKGAKEENLRTAVPFVRQLSDTEKIKEEFSINGDTSPYKPTTQQQKLYIMTQILAALSVSLGSMVVGFATAYTSPALTTMIHENSTISVTKQEGSWVGGLMPLAALGGGIIGGPLIEYLGRRNTILGSTVPFIVSWVLIGAAPNVYMVYAGRAIGGLCVGIGSLSFPVYLGETVQPEVRGQLGLLPTALGNVGILVAFIAGSCMDWSQLAYLGATLPIPCLLLTFLIPETPRWYVSRGNVEKARQSLEWLRGKNTNVEPELKEIMKNHSEGEANATNSGICELFTPEHIRPVLISLGLMFFQQMSGINAVIFYTVSIFKDAGSTIDENLSTIIVGVVNFASTFFATLLIERLGRKILLYISSVAMILTLMILGSFFYVKMLDLDTSAYGWLPLASFVIYVIGFSLGFGPIPWLMMGEILPGRIRGTAASVATAFNWSCTFFVTKTFNDIIDCIGTHGTFWMFGLVCVVGLFFTVIWVPETMGRSLEDIEHQLSGRSRKPSKISADSKALTIEC